VTISRKGLQSVVLLVSAIGGAEYHDSKAFNIFQTGHLLSRHLVKQKFHNKDYKMLLKYYALIDHLKTVKKTPMTVFCKLVIFWAVMWLSENFTQQLQSVA